MKNRLQRHFRTAIIITEVTGMTDVDSFRRTSSSILHAVLEGPCTKDKENEKLSFLQTAVKLIMTEIISIRILKIIDL